MFMNKSLDEAFDFNFLNYVTEISRLGDEPYEGT